MAVFPYWLQVDVALAPDGREAANVHRLFGRLTPAFEEQRGEGGFLGCSFQRERPDIRLRIALDERSTDRMHEQVVAAIDEPLSASVAAGEIVDHRWTAYEPDVARFGGIHAMAVAHHHFLRDTVGWYRVERMLRASPGGGAGPEAAEADVRHDLDALRVVASTRLVDEAFEHPVERRAVWRRLHALTGGDIAGPARALLAPGELAGALDPLIERLPEGVVTAVLDEARGSGADCRRGSPMHRGPELGRSRIEDLEAAVELVALVVHFDANRWGVDDAGQRWMAETLAP